MAISGPTISGPIGPQYRLICSDAGDCMVRYCFERARYWAIWNGIISITRATLSTRKAVCHSHREAIHGRAWNEVSEIFRTT
jgi:hypothetical protein